MPKLLGIPIDGHILKICFIWLLRVDPDVYVKYYNVCGYDVKHDDDSSLQTPSEPYCFLETSFLKPLVTLVVSPAFPLSPLALIHIRQSITAYVTMRAVFSSTCDLYCGVSEMRVTVKGIEVDFKFSIQSQDGEVLAKGVSTVLSRNQITRKSFKERGNRDSQPFSGEKGIQATFSVSLPLFHTHACTHTHTTHMHTHTHTHAHNTHAHTHTQHTHTHTHTCTHTHTHAHAHTYTHSTSVMLWYFGVDAIAL